MAPHGPTHPYEGAAGTDCCQNESLLPVALKIRRWPKCVPASGGMALVGLQRGHPLLLFSLPLPHPQEGFPKGRNRSFAPLCPEGVWGTAASPMFLFRGSGGHSLFKREYPLGFSVPKRYSSAGNSGNLCAKDSFPLPCSGNYPLREHHITLALRTAPRYCCPSPLRR